MAGKVNQYPVLSLILMDGHSFEPGGEPIPLTTELYEQLKGSGAIGLEPVDAPAELTAEERAVAIREAVSKLPPEELTAAGKPKVASVAKAVGFSTDAAEIAAALAAA